MYQSAIILLLLCCSAAFAHYLPYFDDAFDKNFYAGKKKYIKVSYKEDNSTTATNVQLHLIKPNAETIKIASGIPISNVQPTIPSTGVLYGWKVPDNLVGEYTLRMTYTKVFIYAQPNKSKKNIVEERAIIIHKCPLNNLTNDNFPTLELKENEEWPTEDEVGKLAHSEESSEDGSEDDPEIHATRKLVYLHINEPAAKFLFGTVRRNSNNQSPPSSSNSASSSKTYALALMCGLLLLIV